MKLASQDYLLRTSSESPHWCETFAPSVWSCSSQGFDQPPRAAKVHEDFVKAVRCQTCEDTSQKKPTHKTKLPWDYRFSHTLGIDLLDSLAIRNTGWRKQKPNSSNWAMK